MGSGDSSTLNALLQTYFEKKALQALREDVYLRQSVAPENVIALPRGEGKTAQWSAWRRIGPVTAAVDEVAASAYADVIPVDLSCRKVQATISTYGRVVRYTDLIEKISVLNVQQGALSELTQSAALTVDNLMQYAIFQADLTRCGKDATAANAAKLLSALHSAVASAFCANTGTSNTSNKQFGFPVVLAGSATRLSAVSATAPSTSAQASPNGINKAVAELKRLGAKPYANGRYHCHIHTYGMRDLLGNPDSQKFFVGYESGVKETTLRNFVGVMHGCDIMASPNMPRVPSSGSVGVILPTFICGPQALGCVELSGGAGGAIEFIITEPGGTEDPLKLKAQVAYKLRFVAAVLNPSAGRIVMFHEKP